MIWILCTEFPKPGRNKINAELIQYLLNKVFIPDKYSRTVRNGSWIKILFLLLLK